MIESIKGKISNLLRQKKVSLAMIYDGRGEILWHTGREISGNTVEEGQGFSKTFIRETIKKKTMVDTENVVVTSVNQGLPRSAIALKVKRLMIIPFGRNYFLYIDSGKREAFTQLERELFRFLAELLEASIEKIRASEKRMGGVSGSSGAINIIRELVIKYAVEENPILLLGETGVGKSHIAELIHQYSGRSGNFVTINTPGIPENLFESAVFGHKKGAFTDARSDKKGFIDEAEGGTLFFDEISEVPLAFQARLLRFIETNKYNILGESRERKATVRIIAATNKDLNEAIKNKEFREDLYYRLHVLEIEIPALRTRKQDIPIIIREKLELLKGKEVTEDFWQAMQEYDWPGNIRELITVLTRAGILLDSPISGEKIKNIINPRDDSSNFLGRGGEKEKIWQKLKGGKNFWQVVWQPFINRDLNRSLVKGFLAEAFYKASGNFKEMIPLLNLEDTEYHSFMTLMHKYRIDPRC